jgi:myo-inositol-1(or 4)-monophosphatase
VARAALREDFRLLCAAVEEAAGVARRFFETGAQVWMKGPGNPVTEADLAVDKLLHDKLRAARPDYGWLSEESKDDGSRLTARRTWVLDPIDGTRAFVKKQPEFTVAAGLIEDGRPVMGVVVNPATQEFFAACEGGRLRKNGKLTAPLAERSLRSARVLGSRAMIEQAIGATPGTEYFTVNSIAYRMALVAGGTFDAAVALSPTCDWDIVAAHALILAAGGKVSGRHGEPLVYNRPSVRHQGIVAAGPRLHGELTKRFRGGLLG